MSKHKVLKILSSIFIIFLSLSVSAQDKSQAQILFEQAVQFAKEKNFEEALKLLQQSSKLEPRQSAIYNAFGAIYMELRKYDKALENFRKGSQLSPDNPIIRRNLCASLTFNKKADEALPECREAIRLAPDSAINYLQLAKTLREAKQIDEAIRVAENALQKFPNDEDLLFFLGGAYFAKSNYLKELEILEKLVRAKPKVSAYQVALSEAYLRFDRVDEAAETAKKAIDLDVLNPFAYYRLAKVYDEIGMSEEVVSTLQKAVELKPNAGEIYYLFGVNLAKLGNETEAILNLREAVRLMPDFVAAQYELGNKLNSAGRFSDAIEPLRQANKLKSNDLDIKSALSLALLESGNYDEALRFLDEADNLKPNHPIIKMFVDVARARKQGVAEIEKVKQRVANNPKDIEAKKYLANLYKFTGKVTEAESLLLEAIRLQPESAEAHNDLAIFYADQRRHDKAIKLYRRATELKSHHILYLSLGNSLRKLGRNEEAFEAFRKAIDIKPDSIHPLKFYADALRETGKRREAVEIYQKILKIEPNNSPALFNLAILSLKLMDLESAQRYYETLRKADAPLAKNLSWILRLKK